MSIVLPAIILSAMGAAFGVALAFASAAFSVKPDERIALVRGVLPGVNCAVCGYSGCDAYASAVAAGAAAANLCNVGGQAAAQRIGELLGIDAGNVAVKAARVKCCGTDDACGVKYDYDGIESCAAASLAQGGPKACVYGCLGYGDCVKACIYGAAYIKNGAADVVASRCAACGMCVKACPKRLIALYPVDETYAVCCANKDRGAAVARYCSAGCIGCKRCAAVCRAGAIAVRDNLATIDPLICMRCGECAKACPRRCIQRFDCSLNRTSVLLP